MLPRRAYIQDVLKVKVEIKVYQHKIASSHTQMAAS